MATASIAAANAGRPAAGTVRKQRKPPTLKTVLVCAVAYVIGLIFILPYLEMIITALRPQSELRAQDYLPHHITFSAFTSIWSTGLGANFAVSLEIAFGATALVLLVAIPAAYYTSRRRFRGRGAFLILVLCTQMFQPTSLVIGIYQERSEERRVWKECRSRWSP